MVWLWPFSQTRLGPRPSGCGEQAQGEGNHPPLSAELKAETQGQAQRRSAQAQRGRLRETPCTRGERSSLAALAVAVAVASGVNRRRKRRGHRPAPSGSVLYLLFRRRRNRMKTGFHCCRAALKSRIVSRGPFCCT